MAQTQVFSLPVPMGAYGAAQASVMYGQTLADGTNIGNAVMSGAVPYAASNPTNTGTAAQGSEIMKEKATSESPAEPPDNDLIDFDAF